MITSFPMCLMALSHQKPFPVALPNGLGSATCCLTQWRTREGSHRCPEPLLCPKQVKSFFLYKTARLRTSSLFFAKMESGSEHSGV